MTYLMLIFKKRDEIQVYLTTPIKQGKSIGFVPTMGALHNGHISLIKNSKSQCDVTICSIFVNPLQFNDKNDLKRYPRMPEKDIALLETANCDILFLPEVEEVYNDDAKFDFDFGTLDKVLEGKYRAGHFNGVAQVVKRLFDIVKPNKAFFGSKDFQQVMIVKSMLNQTKLGVEVVSCPILREKDGLAMSSRNTLLSEEERSISAKIPEMMEKAKTIALVKGIASAQKFISEEVLKNPLMKLDYYEICDPENLETLSELKENKAAISLIALYIGKVRLIDNLTLKE